MTFATIIKGDIIKQKATQVKLTKSMSKGTLLKFVWTTRQVYNGPRTSNLSQQQQQTFWSKMIFEQQNQKKIADFFSEKIYGKKKF